MGLKLPELTQNWVPGIVKLTNEQVIDGLKCNYKVYCYPLYVQYSDTDYVIESNDSINDLILDGKKLFMLFRIRRNRIFTLFGLRIINKLAKAYFALILTNFEFQTGCFSREGIR